MIALHIILDIAKRERERGREAKKNSFIWKSKKEEVIYDITNSLLDNCIIELAITVSISNYCDNREGNDWRLYTFHWKPVNEYEND